MAKKKPLSRKSEYTLALKRPDGAKMIREARLLRFRNRTQVRRYTIEFTIPEFTCLCPVTGFPDFATIAIRYIPRDWCVELKSLKMYMWSYRDEGAFHEAVTNKILDDIVKVTNPRFARIKARWYVRGGIYTNIVAEHRQKGWKPAPPVEFPGFPMETGLLGS